jgi:quercetin dioxygenase-like cupin family protein
MTRVPFLMAAGLVALLPLTAIADDAVVTSADGLKWGPAPPALPKGAQMAILYGDPSKEGPFVTRTKFPAGYKVPAHMHPMDENVTVLSGTLHIGMGDKLDPGKGEEVKAGGYIHMPKGMHHYAWTTEETVVQQNTIGPSGITYLNPADDPRKTN